MGLVYGPHVAFLAFPFGTHAAPLFSLARALASSVPDAAFSFIGSARSNASLSHSAAPSAGKIWMYEISDWCPEGHVLPVGNPEKEVKLFLKETPGNYRAAMEDAAARGAGVRITCVVSDAFLSFAGEMAAEMGVPWVPLWTSGPCSLLAHLNTDLLRRRIRGGKDDEGLDFIPGLSGIRVCDLPEGVVSGNLTGTFAVLLHRMATELPRSATAIVFNSFNGLPPNLDSQFDTLFKSSLPIGPLNLLAPNPPEPDHFNCLPWLDRHSPSSVAYIGFGTVVPLRPHELAELAVGLEASGGPFLWSLKEQARQFLPTGFVDRTKDRGLIVPWAPQIRVLEHVAVGAFVTHCGWNSVAESLTAGVPMVCRPFMGDQKINARVISHVWECGVGLEGGVATRDGMVKALGMVLKGEEGKRMRERAGEIREKAVRAVEPDGSSAQNFKKLVELVTGC